MKSKRLHEVEALYRAALERDPAERQAYLDEACAADEDLRGEIESLLAYDERAAGFLEIPAMDVEARSMAADCNPSLMGKTVLHYHILERLGAGGMGVVYKAEDTKLRRPVALKFLPDDFAKTDPNALERFRREARATSALNHPNICTIHDIQESEGQPFIVMEFVNGTPVAHSEDLGEVLDVAIQIADGLAAAHAAGVIHRDLKPDNILVVERASANPGRVKILDFGLAKMTSAAAVTPGNLPTRLNTITDPGTTVGTVNYMSPEQARADGDMSAQSDQFSFGLVLYEMLTGKRTFDRASGAETMTAIIREEPEPLPSTTPAPLHWIINRLLSKDPAGRYDSTRDLYRDLCQVRDHLAELATPAGPAALPVARSKRLRLIATAAVAVAALVLGGATILALLPDMEYPALEFTPVSRMDATERWPAWSPDGKTIAFTATVRGIDQVFIKEVDSPVTSDAAQITNASRRCTAPFWSPDGSRIYYHSDNNLWSVLASGGTPSLVLMNASGVSMHPDGKTVVFTRDGKLWVDVLGTNQPRQFSASPFPNDRASGAQFSPDGKKVLAIARDEQWILAYPSGAAYKLPSDRLLYTSTWLPDSRHLLEIENSPPSYYFNSNLFLVDTETVTRRRVYSSGEFMLTPALSPDGRRLAYSRGLIEWNVLEIMIPSGTVRTALGGSGVIWGWPDWAPSGNHFLVATARSGPLALEDVSSSEGFSRRLYGGEPNEIVGMGRWSPDGSRFAFLAGGRSSSSVQLRIANSSGGRATTVVDHNVGAGGAPSWSPDGQWIAYIQAKPLAVAKIRADATGGPAILVELSSADVPGWTGDRSVQWSPPGKEIAYPTARGVMVVSPDSKTTRLLTARKFIVFGFSREGARLYGIERDTAGKGAQWQLYEVNVATGADKALGAVDLPASTDALTGFSMHPDGTRFLTSIAKWPYDIWMIEGLNPPKSWIDRFLRR